MRPLIWDRPSGFLNDALRELIKKRSKRPNTNKMRTPVFYTYMAMRYVRCIYIYIIPSPSPPVINIHPEFSLLGVGF